MACCLAAIVAAEVLKKTVMISTATVALQEQLIHKDLPRLAGIIPELTFDILKGRARYVCQSRLEGVIEGIVPDSELAGELQDLFADSRRPAASVVRDSQAAMRWFKSSAKKLNAGVWDGDIDALAQPPDPQDWRQVQANAYACNGGQAEHFRGCAFFKARRQAAGVTVQVANHALVLATLQTDSSLIDAGNTLFLFDEAHHLPAIAAEQFSYRVQPAADWPAHGGAAPCQSPAGLDPSRPGSLWPARHELHRPAGHARALLAGRTSSAPICPSTVSAKAGFPRTWFPSASSL